MRTIVLAHNRDMKKYIWEIAKKSGQVVKPNDEEEAELCIAYIRKNFVEDIKKLRAYKETNRKLLVVAILESYDAMSKLYELGHEYSLLYKNVADELLEGIELVRKNIKKNKNRFAFFSKGKKRQLFYEEICFVEIQGRTMTIHTMDGDAIETNCSLKTFLEKAPKQFVRTHSSYAINTLYLKQVSYTECLLKGNKTVPVSRKNREKVLTLL